MRHAVVVAVEARIGRLADTHLDPLVGGIERIGQGQQVLLGEVLAHRNRTVLRTGTIHRPAIAPGLGLGVEVIEILPVPGGPELIADGADGPLHRCPPWRAKRRRVVPGSREATRDARRAEGAKGDPKGASERGVQSYGRPVCSRNELAMLWRNAG